MVWVSWGLLNNKRVRYDLVTRWQRSCWTCSAAMIRPGIHHWHLLSHVNVNVCLIHLGMVLWWGSAWQSCLHSHPAGGRFVKLSFPVTVAFLRSLQIFCRFDDVDSTALTVDWRTSEISPCAPKWEWTQNFRIYLHDNVVLSQKRLIPHKWMAKARFSTFPKITSERLNGTEILRILSLINYTEFWRCCAAEHIFHKNF